MILEVAENYLLKYIPFSKTPFIRNILNYFLVIHNRAITYTESFDTLLSIIVSISSIFIGLYFTAIGVVASSVFVRVPGNLRALLLKEKTGNQYIRILSMLASISIILLGYKSFGGIPGIFTSLFVIICGCFGIFCFVVLGFRAFYFFDPAKLSNDIFLDLNNNVRLSTIHGFRWAEQSFQAHYRKLATETISTLNALIKHCAKESQLEKHSLSPILQQTVRFLIYYKQQCAFIPLDSYWYMYVPRYKSSFLYDSISLTMSLRTQTSLQPEMVPNSYWVEDDIVEILIHSFEKALQKNNFEVVYETLNILSKYFIVLGSNLEAKKGRDIMSKLSKPIEEYYNSCCSKDSKEKYKDIEIALFDIYGMAIVSLSIGFYKLISDLDVQSILKKIDSVNWINDKSIYVKGILSIILPRMEFMQKKLKFEKKIENNIFSPRWYIRQLIVVRYVEQLHESIDEILKCLEELFVSKSDALLSKKSFTMVAYHSRRGLEMCNKIVFHLPKLKVLVDNLNKMQINKELPWPKWDWNQIENRINKSYDRLIENLAKCIPILSVVEHEENLPDIFGMVYNTVCQDCYKSMILKNPEKFKKIFPLLFFGSLKAHETLRKKLKDWQPETSLNISFEPLLDIMEISGYAKIYSELFNIQAIWDICETTWNVYLDTLPNPTKTLEYFIKLCEYRMSLLFQTTPRDSLRTNWRIDFENKLQKMDLVDPMFSSNYYSEEDTKTKHNSSLIRALCRGRYEPHVSSAEVFIIIYMLKRKESKDIKFDDRYGLSKQIKNEEDSINENTTGGV
ncbi:MAG: hypothetical protein MRK02_00615 [Candidatus Scalindua sp.]|nr:hypothetical protein [Candidatus Scalindua sp.]